MLIHVLIGIGGMIGAVLRYDVGLFVSDWWAFSFPVATLLTNYLGSFLLGWLTTGMIQSKRLPTSIAVPLSTGVIGSFTTFSTFSVETVQLMKDAEYILAFIYVSLSISGGLILAKTGYELGQRGDAA